MGVPVTGEGLFKHARLLRRLLVSRFVEGTTSDELAQCSVIAPVCVGKGL
jgi:hypothetical protein